MKSYMVDRRREVETWSVGDFIIDHGVWADTVLEHMPRDLMMRMPITLGKDDDGLVVEWCYTDVIFTLARASTIDVRFGKIEVYAIQKIEEIIPKEEMENG